MRLQNQIQNRLRSAFTPLAKHLLASVCCGVFEDQNDQTHEENNTFSIGEKLRTRPSQENGSKPIEYPKSTSEKLVSLTASSIENLAYCRQKHTCFLVSIFRLVATPNTKAVKACQ
jgi:hypothetical protein